MQARIQWSPPSGVLGRLAETAAERASAVAGRVEEWRMQSAGRPAPPSLQAALRRGGDVAVIAELKRRSPSKGDLSPSLNAAERAREYVAGGARGISVLTEPAEFGGRLEDLGHAAHAVPVPVLRKDFLVHPAQIWEARVAGASAVLLIVRALGPDGTIRLVAEARAAGVESLVEVRDELELGWALDAGAEIIGVNRRNLETLVMEDGVMERLLPRIPTGRIAVAESGVRSRADVEVVAEMGADAVLVGSSLSTAPDGTRAVRALTGVTRRSRAS